MNGASPGSSIWKMMKHIKNFFIARKGTRPPLAVAIVNFLLVCLLLIALFWISLQRIGVALDFSFVVEYQDRLWDGFLMTLALGLCGFLISFLIGLLSVLGQRSNILVIRYFCNLYVTVIRGTPLIMQIYLFFYILGTAWGLENRFVSGVLILSFFEGAYIAEILRGGIQSVDNEQLEAARAIGFSKWQTIRFVWFPQLTSLTAPALTGQFASLIKDSSLLSMIAVTELTQTIREITSSNLKLFEGYFFLGVLYLCLTLPITFLSKWLERRMRYEA